MDELEEKWLANARMNIKLAAQIRGMPLSTVATKAGMSRNGISQFVSGRTSLSYVNMLKVCSVLSISIATVHLKDSVTPTALGV
jgi:DNA-binding phage protein